MKFSVRKLDCKKNLWYVIWGHRKNTGIGTRQRPGHGNHSRAATTATPHIHLLLLVVEKSGDARRLQIARLHAPAPGSGFWARKVRALDGSGRHQLRHAFYVQDHQRLTTRGAFRGTGRRDPLRRCRSPPKARWDLKTRSIKLRLYRSAELPPLWSILPLFLGFSEPKRSPTHRIPNHYVPRTTSKIFTVHAFATNCIKTLRSRGNDGSRWHVMPGGGVSDVLAEQLRKICRHVIHVDTCSHLNSFLSAVLC